MREMFAYLLAAQISHRLFHLLRLIDDDNFSFKRRYREPLEKIFTDMMRLISHVMRVKRQSVCVPNGQRKLGDKELRHRS